MANEKIEERNRELLSKLENIQKSTHFSMVELTTFVKATCTVQDKIIISFKDIQDAMEKTE